MPRGWSVAGYQRARTKGPPEGHAATEVGDYQHVCCLGSEEAVCPGLCLMLTSGL